MKQPPTASASPWDGGPLVDTELEHGLLVQPWRDTVEIETGYWLAIPPRRRSEPMIELFRDWLLQQIPTA